MASVDKNRGRKGVAKYASILELAEYEKQPGPKDLTTVVKFTNRVYELSFRADFMGHLYVPSLLVIFTGYGCSSQVKFTG